MSAHTFADNWLAREDYRALRQVEREVYPSIQQMEAERRRATPRRKTEPAEDFRPEALLDGLVTSGG